MKLSKNCMASLTLILLMGLTSTAHAGGIFYFGAGQADEENAQSSGDTPFVIGGLGFSQESKMVFGFDLAREGTMLDSTFGQDSLSQALSVNVLLGRNFYDNGTIRVDAAGILGIRETFADCPDSFLGFQCYADTAPSTEYDVNYGALLTVSFSRASLGVRITGESTQAVLGLKF